MHNRSNKNINKILASNTNCLGSGLNIGTVFKRERGNTFIYQPYTYDKDMVNVKTHYISRICNSFYVRVKKISAYSKCVSYFTSFFAFCTKQPTSYSEHKIGVGGIVILLNNLLTLLILK
jgi:hypothetical protein